MNGLFAFLLGVATAGLAAFWVRNYARHPMRHPRSPARLTCIDSRNSSIDDDPLDEGESHEFIETPVHTFASELECESTCNDGGHFDWTTSVGLNTDESGPLSSTYLGIGSTHQDL